MTVKTALGYSHGATKAVRFKSNSTSLSVGATVPNGAYLRATGKRVSKYLEHLGTRKKVDILCRTLEHLMQKFMTTLGLGSPLRPSMYSQCHWQEGIRLKRLGLELL